MLSLSKLLIMQRSRGGISRLSELRHEKCIHLIEKTLSLEKYKPSTMGPNGFMGTTLLALQI